MLPSSLVRSPSPTTANMFGVDEFLVRALPVRQPRTRLTRQDSRRAMNSARPNTHGWHGNSIDAVIRVTLRLASVDPASLGEWAAHATGSGPIRANVSVPATLDVRRQPIPSGTAPRFSPLRGNCASTPETTSSTISCNSACVTPSLAWIEMPCMTTARWNARRSTLARSANG